MQVSRADLHRRCTEGKGRQYATSVGDAPSSDNGHLHGVNHLWHQRHCADLRRNILREKHAPMSAGLKTLGDNCVASLILKPTRFIDRSGGGQDLRSGFPNAEEEILVWKTEMEAHDLRMKLRHEIAHFFVERSASGVWKGRIAINLQLDVIGIQALSPVYFPGAVHWRRLVTEEVCIDGARCFPADGFKLLACVFHAQ